MSIKKQLIAFVVLFFLTAIGNFVIHGVLLRPSYMQVKEMMRSEQDGNANAMFLIVVFVFFCLGMVWIYAHKKQTETG